MPVFLLPALLCGAWTLIAGKDVNWDLLNYHYYLPFELVAGRVEQDFFAASAQSYLNPLGYLPFYLMVSAGWHSVIVSLVLAVAASTSIAFLYLLAWRLFAHLAPKDRVSFSCLATALGCANAVFWETAGTSFIDPLLLPPMLAGLLLVLNDRTHPQRQAAAAGALFGMAAALKYSNAIFAVAALPLAIVMPGLRGPLRWRAGLCYAAGGVVAVAVLAGPWLVVLLREFGNPVFPLLNGWFRSPDALLFNMANARFSLEGLQEVLRFPFRLIALDRSLYSENFAPDLRFAALLAAGGLLAVPALRRRRAEAAPLNGTDVRLAGFFALSLALWLLTSANARYGLLVLLLAGLGLARAVERLLRPGAARVVLAVLLAVQLAMTILASPKRWFIAEPWSKHWLAFDVPAEAVRKPALYLTLEALPMAVLAPFLHRDSSLANFRGQLSIPPDSPRLATLLARYSGRVRTLGRALQLIDGRPSENMVELYDQTLVRIGYRVDPGDCFTVAWRPRTDDLLSRAANRLAGNLPSHEPLSVVSCALVPTPIDLAVAETERRMSELFDRIETACPRLFRGQTAVTEPLLEGWSRNYNGLDARLEAFGERMVLNFYQTHRFVDLGKRSQWEGSRGFRPPACGEPTL